MGKSTTNRGGRVSGVYLPSRHQRRIQPRQSIICSQVADNMAAVPKVISSPFSYPHDTPTCGLASPATSGGGEGVELPLCPGCEGQEVRMKGQPPYSICLLCHWRAVIMAKRETLKIRLEGLGDRVRRKMDRLQAIAGEKEPAVVDLVILDEAAFESPRSSPAASVIVDTSSLQHELMIVSKTSPNQVLVTSGTHGHQNPLRNQVDLPTLEAEPQDTLTASANANTALTMALPATTVTPQNFAAASATVLPIKSSSSSTKSDSNHIQHADLECILIQGKPNDPSPHYRNSFQFLSATESPQVAPKPVPLKESTPPELEVLLVADPIPGKEWLAARFNELD
ncbi:hypothetical protein EV426DRAFT_707327 [Tirmania nivea]|nr:hypothetical protein EV426DRAFT_707327 [Tirmania nivea]